MIHIIHTPAATLALRRMRLVCQCSFCVALAGIGVVVAASQFAILYTTATECNFTGVPFIPAKTESSPHMPILPISAAPATPPDLPALPIAYPETLSFCEEFEVLSESADEAEEILETDVEPLLQQAPPQAHMKPKIVTADESAIFTPPDYLICPRPPYPPQLRHRRVQGQVGVLISISAEGLPTKVEITHGSGTPQLDRHTRSWIMQHWRFRPAHNGSRPVEAQVRTSISYSLRS